MIRTTRVLRHSIAPAAMLGLALLPAAPAGAGTHLLAVRGGSLYTIDVSGPTPIVHGPFLDQGTTIRKAIVLRDEPAALILAGGQVRRVDLADPLAPAITASVTLPSFVITDFIAGGLRPYSVVLGEHAELVAVDHTSLALGPIFDAGALREAGALSPDGRTLATFDPHSPYIHLTSFDPQLGLGPDVTCTPSFGVPDFTFGFFSPDGRTLGVVQNSYWFRPAADGGDLPPYYAAFIDTFELGAGACVHRSAYDPTAAADAISGHAYSRGGGQLLFIGAANPDYQIENQLLRFTPKGSSIEPGPPTGLTIDGAGFGAIGRAKGGHEIYLSTGDPSGIKLHRYLPATGTLASFDVGLAFASLEAFETAGAFFADGFESGNTAAWASP